MILITLIVIALLVLGIWIFSELERWRHKFWTVFLIGLLLFSYLSFVLVLKNKDIDYHSFSGIFTAGKIYFSWLGNIFVNLKTITANAIKMDWTNTNSTS
ncbi:hypothetical protein DRN73_07305 [Candidatus Pacearchaeota archaeon]|nr:MAG: hypothetical protein DRN73_07305 [Candidatus Pacearchaeota archaeon]